MDEKYYPFERIRINFRYEFLSISNKKRVKKVVLFSKIEDNVYNLALFDELANGLLSDSLETKNEDLLTVMATVIQIVKDFLDKNPTSFIIFRGNEEKRQRLYRIIISREFSKISKFFEVYGGVGDEFLSLYEPNQNYDYFLIKKL